MKRQKEFVLMLFFLFMGLSLKAQVNTQSIEDYRTLRIWDIQNERWIESSEYFSSILDFEVVGDKIFAITKETPKDLLLLENESLSRGIAPIVNGNLIVFSIKDNQLQKDTIIAGAFESMEISNSENIILNKTGPAEIFNTSDYTFLSPFADYTATSIANIKSYPNGYSAKYRYDSLIIKEGEKIFTHYFPDEIISYRWMESGKLIGLKNEKEREGEAVHFIIYQLSESREIGDLALEVDYVLDYEYVNEGKLIILTRKEDKIECTLYDVHENFKSIRSFTIPSEEYFYEIDLQNNHTFSLIGYNKIFCYSIEQNEPFAKIEVPTLKGKNRYSGTAYLQDRKWFLISQRFEDRGDLHLGSIGYYPDVTEPEKDAITFIEEFTSYKRNFYENVFNYNLLGEKVNKSNIDSLFFQIEQELTGDDDFNLFFSGGAYDADSLGQYIIVTNDLKDSTPYDSICKVCLDGAELVDLLMPIVKKSTENLIILDLNGSEIIYEGLTNVYNAVDVYNNVKVTRGVGPISRLMNPNLYFIGIKKNHLFYENVSQNGFTISYLLAALAGAADFPCPGDGLVTTAELGAFLSLNSSDQYPVFVAGDQQEISLVKENKFLHVDLQKPVIIWVQKTDSATEKKSFPLHFQLTDNAGIYELQVNNKEKKLTQDNKYFFDIPLRLGTNKIVIKATDISGNFTNDTISVIRNVPKIGPVNHALFIATNEYTGGLDEETRWSKLRNPIRDAEAIASELAANYDFDTTIIRNATLDDIEHAIKKTAKENYNAADQLFVFIAGHGYHDDFQGFLVAKDSDGRSSRSYVSYDDLKAWLPKNHPCKHILLTLDVCGGGTFFDNIASSLRRNQTRGTTVVTTSEQEFQSELREVNDILTRYSTRIALTSSDERDVFDGKEHSPFALEFLHILRETKKGSIIDSNALFQAVQKQKSSRPILHDFEGGEPGSNFYFIRRR